MVVIKGFLPTQNKSKIPDSLWAVSLSSNFYLHLYFGLKKKLYQGWAKIFGPNLSHYMQEIVPMKFGGLELSIKRKLSICLFALD